MPNKESFLCRHCKSAMCTDCRQIAEEYQELCDNRGQSLYSAEKLVAKANAERDTAIRERDDLRQILDIGQHKLILAWMNSLSSSKLLDAVKNADQGAEEQ